jgi:hypothetical protein
MVDYLHDHHFLLLPLHHLRNSEREPSSFIYSFHHMQKHMSLKKLAPLVEPFFVTSQMPLFSQSQWLGHLTHVLHVVKNGDDAPISLLW